jgi:hypothetical protein
MLNATTITNNYEKQLPTELLPLYKSIVKERTQIYFTGYFLGFILSVLFILYNIYVKKEKYNALALVCIIITISFLTNYFFYILSPKKNWMLDNIKSQEQIKAWMKMYKGMQITYHTGLVLGIISMGFLAYAFC